MIIIGCDYHPGFRQIAFVDTDTGELRERRLPRPEEAEQFYRDLAAQGMKVRAGIEASGHARWFERLLAELNFELRIGDAAEIRLTWPWSQPACTGNLSGTFLKGNLICYWSMLSMSRTYPDARQMLRTASGLPNCSSTDYCVPVLCRRLGFATCVI